MPPPYNMSGIDGAGNLGELIVEFNSLSNNLFGVGICAGVFFVATILLLQRSPPPEAFTASSFLTTLVSLGLWAAGLVAIYWVILFTFIFAASLTGLLLSNKQL